MRRILVDDARHRERAKRGGNALRVSLDEGAIVAQGRASELIALDDGLLELAAIDRMRSQVVELRFFGGLSVEETAEVLGISPNTVVETGTWLRRGCTVRSAKSRTMKAEHWQQVSVIFKSALEREPKERTAYLNEACSSDDSLRGEVESLIGAYEQAGDFIEPDALEVAAASFHRRAA